MSSVAVFVGLDYHTFPVQVCVMTAEGRVLSNEKVDNCWQAIVRHAERLGDVQEAAIEACCGAASLADELRQRAGWKVQLAHPGYVARMKGNPDKTDFGDAQLLADLLRVGYLPVVWLAPDEIRQLRRLVRERDIAVKERRSTKLRIRALLRELRLRSPRSINVWTQRWFGWLESLVLSDNDRWILNRRLKKLASLTGSIREAENHLRSVTKNDAVVRALMKLEGVGLITAVTLRAEIGHFGRFRNGKQLAKFCGVTPRNASSGQRQADAGLIKAGNPLLRSVIIETAQRLVWRLDSRSLELFHRLGKAGKPRNVAIAAVANRWVRWLYYQIKEETLAV